MSKSSMAAALVRSSVRASAFVRKELVQILRQPRVLMTLVVGPFLILLLFGAGLRDEDPAVRTIFVAPQDPRVAAEVEEFAQAQRERLTVVAVQQDERDALRRLASGEVQMVLVFPDDPEPTIRSNRQAVVTVYHDQVDPLETQAIDLFTRTGVDEINQQTLRRVVSESQREARDLGRPDPGTALDELLTLSPDVIVSPFDGEAERVVGGGDVHPVDFYAPGVVALLIQHLTVTFVGLSIVRERELGTTELFRVAPLSALEALAGKSIAFVLLGAVVAGPLAALLVFGLGVPMLGSWVAVGVIVLLLLLASTGLGLVLALLAQSDSQAVQYAMMLLLGSIFFSGFLLSLGRFQPYLTWVAQILPVTHAVGLLRDEMLRGQLINPLSLVLLAALALVFFVLSGRLLRRRLGAA